MKNTDKSHSNIINFNDKRLDKRQRGKPRYGSATQTIIDDLHRLRFLWDELARERNLPRYYDRRPYEIEQQQRFNADRKPTSINNLVKRLRQLARPAIVLHFPKSATFIDRTSSG